MSTQNLLNIYSISWFCEVDKTIIIVFIIVYYFFCYNYFLCSTEIFS